MSHVADRTTVTRFAPSPSGNLHVGGARTALFCYAFAKGHDGRFVLRIEDTDQKRSSEAAGLGFLADLDWLGLHWDEGPVFTCQDGRSVGGGEHGPYFQSERLATYDAAIDRLIAEGKAYLAFDTPEELDAARQAARAEKRAFRYDGAAARALSDADRERLRAEGRPCVVRFASPQRDIVIRDEILGEATLPAGEVDDFVIRKADGFPTYHFAVVLDDAAMQVTHVLRAQEHFNNTAKHLLLQEALGLPHPTYAHLPIIFNPDGSKMSKRDKDKALREAAKTAGLEKSPDGPDGSPIVDEKAYARWLGDKTVQLPGEAATTMAAALGVALPEIDVEDFRRSGYLPEVLVNFLALNGWSPGDDLEKFDLAFLCQRFALDRVVKTPARFDRAKLLAFNLDAIQQMDEATFLARLLDHGRRYHPGFIARLGEERMAALAAASHARSKTLDEPYVGNAFLVADDESISWPPDKAIDKALRKGEPNGLANLAACVPALQAIDEHAWNVATLERVLETFVAERELGNIGKVAQPLRVAVSGGTVSPPIFDTLEMLGRRACLRRIERCLAAFEHSNVAKS